MGDVVIPLKVWLLYECVFERENPVGFERLSELLLVKQMNYPPFSLYCLVKSNLIELIYSREKHHADKGVNRG